MYLGVIFEACQLAEKHIPSQPTTRINKYICESGHCSRKAADGFVKRGLVLIDGKRAELGDKVPANSQVSVDGIIVKPLPADEVVFIALNKPTGIVCTATESVAENIVNFVNHDVRIYPVGRLDKASQGLMFLTNRCDLVDKILRGQNQHEKEYLVTVNKPVTDEFLTGVSQGVPMLGTITKQCRASRVSNFEFRITLVQGLNRQIRRMCKHFGYSVKKLERVRIMHVSLDGLAIGQWRDLSTQEFNELVQSLEHESPR